MLEKAASSSLVSGFLQHFSHRMSGGRNTPIPNARKHSIVQSEYITPNIKKNGGTKHGI